MLPMNGDCVTRENKHHPKIITTISSLNFHKIFKPGSTLFAVYKALIKSKKKEKIMTPKKMSLVGVFAIAFVLITGCTNTSHIEKDPSTDLGKYKTYTWIDKDNQSKSHVNDIAEQNVRYSVNEELQKNGWREVKNNPDVLVSYDVLVEKNVRQQNDPVYSEPYTRLYYNPYTRRYSRLYYPSQFLGYDRNEIPVKEGTVTITLIDPKLDKTIWQGWVTNEVSSSNITGKEIQKNVKSIFKKFDAK